MNPHPDGAIVIAGARVHNLKNVTVEIPLNSLTVVTGVSGSGKSSLAFDTLYAEGQRRYVASLSAYARQFLERMEKPEVDDIRGICPALAIRQKNYTRNPRSTVGTVTEINDYLRLLYARIGITLCRVCGRLVSKDSAEAIAAFVMALPAGTRLYLCVPVELEPEEGAGSRRPEAGSQQPGPRRPKPETRRKKAAAGEGLARGQARLDRLVVMLPGLRQQGFVRLVVGPEVVDLGDAVEALERHPTAPVHLLVDRIAVAPEIEPRLVDSIEVCSREAEGRVELLFPSTAPEELQHLLAARFPEVRWTTHPQGTLVKFSERFECQLCHIPYEVPEPQLFSFNNPFGACPECQGFGNTISLDLGRVVPDGRKSLAAGAVHPWTRPRYRAYQNRLLEFAAARGIDAHVPWSELPQAARDAIAAGGRGFPGIFGFFDHLEEKKYKMHVRIFLSRYRGYTLCRGCGGERLRPEARDVVVGGRRISEVTRMTVREAAAFFRTLELAAHQAAVAAKVLDEIRHRLDLLLRVGLDYLALDRLSSSLSGGESQRIQLATSLGSTLVGALYVLDEPSIGLHARDSRRLVEILRSLKELGNTVLVVEHDPEIMSAADHIIDLGPGAGDLGGRVVFQGSYRAMAREPKSLTGRYVARELKIALPLFRRNTDGRFLQIRNARKHNLKGIDVRVPLGVMTCVTGVSGSGKSTLVHNLLYPAIKKAKGEWPETIDGYDALDGSEQIADAVMVDQSPIGKTPRSNPVTYVKAFDDIREIFAGTREAYARSLGAGHFSFNLPGGRCETCQGSGTITVEMQFLADVELVCEDCKGTRFKPAVLEATYRGRNIAEVLTLTVAEALQFFTGSVGLQRKLRVLDSIGLGYLRLGQSATTLSGGEAQRIKLAAYIARKSAGRVLYVFDEPTTGLHFDDIRKLLAAFEKLIDAGNSVLVIEHNLDVIKTADWIVDLGPEGGDAGGQVVFEGTPEGIVKCRASHTGECLGQYLRAR